MKRVISSDNHGFPKIIEIENNSQWTEPKIFPPHNSSIWDLKTIFERGRAENDEIPKSSFPFQPQTKNGKKVNKID
jgi:hypothetical protein